MLSFAELINVAVEIVVDIFAQFNSILVAMVHAIVGLNFVTKLFFKTINGIDKRYGILFKGKPYIKY